MDCECGTGYALERILVRRCSPSESVVFHRAVLVSASSPRAPVAGRTPREERHRRASVAARFSVLSPILGRSVSIEPRAVPITPLDAVEIYAARSSRFASIVPVLYSDSSCSSQSDRFYILYRPVPYRTVVCRGVAWSTIACVACATGTERNWKRAPSIEIILHACVSYAWIRPLWNHLAPENISTAERHGRSRGTRHFLVECAHCIAPRPSFGIVTTKASFPFPFGVARLARIPFTPCLILLVGLESASLWLIACSLLPAAT